MWLLLMLWVVGAGFVLVSQDTGFMHFASDAVVWLLAPVFASVLTMRSLAQEYKLGTMELLLTAPARVREIVGGKFLAAWLGLNGLLIPLLWLVLFVTRYHNPGTENRGTDFLTLLLLSAAFVGIGMAASSVASAPFLAFLWSMALLYGLWFVTTLRGPSDFRGGGFEMSQLFYFGALTAFSFFLTIAVVSRRRH